MVNAKAALQNAVQIIKNAQIDEALLQARLLFEFVTKTDARLLSPRDELPQATAQQLYALCEKRAAHYPLQYILGKWHFMDFELFVGEGVLIPRADTEAVCLAAAEKCALFSCPRVLDLCAGSGALSRGIKSLVPSAYVTAVELYDKAFEYLELNCADNIRCVKSDIFTYQQHLGENSFDIIVANPPYISLDEMPTLEPELALEPRAALTDEGNGLSFYKHIATNYKHALCNGGWLIFEIGYLQGDAVQDICTQAGWQSTQLLHDLSGNPRVILAQNI